MLLRCGEEALLVGRLELLGGGASTGCERPAGVQGAGKLVRGSDRAQGQMLYPPGGTRPTAQSARAGRVWILNCLPARPCPRGVLVSASNFLLRVCHRILTLKIIYCLSEIQISQDVLCFIYRPSKGAVFLHQLTSGLGSFKLMTQGLPLPSRGPASVPRWRVPGRAPTGWPESGVCL